MGAVIEAVASTHSPGPLWLSKGARSLADAAAKRCLGRAGRRAAEINLLINAGVYREDNLAEPALAAMIQEDLGAHPGHPPETGEHGTFSFDIANGGSGVLTGLQLIDGFLGSKSMALGMVVTSDAAPTHAEGFPFGNTGGAIIARAGEEGRGFTDFAFETFEELEHVFESHVSWRPHEHHLPFGREGENVLAVRMAPGFEGRFLECAATAAHRFLDEHGLAPGDIDLVIPSLYPPGFPAALADRLGLGSDRVATADIEGAHTAGPLFALERAIDERRFQGAERLLFVTVGAGVTVGLALYRP